MKKFNFVHFVGYITIVVGVVWLSSGILGLLGKGEFESVELTLTTLMGITALTVGLGLLKNKLWAIYGYLVIVSLELLNTLVIRGVNNLKLDDLTLTAMEIIVFILLLQNQKKLSK